MASEDVVYLVLREGTKRMFNCEKKVKLIKQRENALAPGAEEGRGKLRKASFRCKQPTKRGYPNGETRLGRAQTCVCEYIAYVRDTP